MAIEYTRFMGKYLQHGHIQPLSEADLRTCSGPVHYILNHKILQSRDQRKNLHLVFNASPSTSSGNSLNDALHARSKFQACLPRIDEHNINAQRIPWNADESVPPQHFQLLTVTYGKASAPYLSLRTILKLCDDKGKAWPKSVAII
ncbi:uncharacterized protein LOC106641013 [Copidosoma floridanum]|uniref:uncharacterized protein LOC106641013 n=1 Tax=Copidosoma floridanum TaxID=29053 RepID=UPI0006C97ECA|nr:uncharacterized protein LOC106641013 [Copidosoma floridanum]